MLRRFIRSVLAEAARRLGPAPSAPRRRFAAQLLVAGAAPRHEATLHVHRRG